MRDSNRISDLCHEKNEPVFITKNGYGDLVVMSIEAYERIMDEVSTDSAINEAEDEYNREGVLFNAEEALSSLRWKHLG